MPGETQRRLAAIVSADVAGYSRLMGEDETGTLAVLRAHRLELIDPLIDKHGGRIVKTMGDGMLLEFPSVVAAVECTAAVQEGMAERNAGVADDEAIMFRVGVHLGDIIVEGDDIFGDGVNVAARLEGLSELNGLALSDDAYRQVRDRLDIAWQDCGEHEVKNIARPVHVWRWQPTSVRESEPAPIESVGLDLTEKPSIAILPFDNMSRDAELEYFGDGMAEDIITTLSKVSGLRVIARNSSFAYKAGSSDIQQVARDLGVRYVLEGSVRGRGNRLRITAQLIDANDGSHIWAERYDRVVEDLFDIQDEITKEIVTNLRVNLTDGEQVRTWAHGTENIKAWHLAVRATELFLRFNTSDYLEARCLAELALAEDSGYAHAMAVEGFTYWWGGRLDYAGEAVALFARASEIADRAMELDNTSAYVIGLKSMTLAAEGKYEASIALAERGVELYPGNADVRAFYALVLNFRGHNEKALGPIRRAMTLNPHHPAWYESLLARLLALRGDYEQALHLIDGLAKRDPEYFLSHLMRAVVLWKLGRHEEARTAVRRVRDSAPNFRSRHLRLVLLAPDEETIAPLVEPLLSAGLPE